MDMCLLLILLCLQVVEVPRQVVGNVNGFK